MKYRKLRISISVAGLLSAVLLVVLCVLSTYRQDTLDVHLSRSKSVGFQPPRRLHRYAIRMGVQR